MALINETGNTPSWNAIFDMYDIWQHNFDSAPFPISSAQIGTACQDFRMPSQKESRILCKQDTRESRPRAFHERGLFILPVRNKHYLIIKGEGYVDVPPIESPLLEYHSNFPFELETTQVGNSEMQHLDRAYAQSLIRHFADDESLVLTIRGRKYTDAFQFVTGEFQIDSESVQTEVDAGYEGANQVVLVEAKSGNATNTIIRQLYYPFRQWQQRTTKPVSTLFFQRRRNDEYHIWHFGFDDVNDYNSIRLLKSARYKIILPY
jgi:hypothetical protein